MFEAPRSSTRQSVIPHAQIAMENLGWQLIGITPRYDREMVAPGVVKRVYEAGTL